jgi:cytochrome P450
MEIHSMSFGYGPRECPGKLLSLIDAPLLIAHIVHHFEFSMACPVDEIRRVFQLTVGPNKMPVIFTPRKDVLAAQ